MSLISQTFDAVVIGSGPAGEGAAMQLCKGGRKVAMVESFREVGGGCTHWGTIPSKALRHTVSQIADFNQSMYLTGGKSVRPDYPLIRKQAESVISRQVKMREGFYIRNEVPVIQGRASLEGPHAVMVESTLPGDGDLIRLEAQTIVIATGSRPYRPADIDFGHPRIFDADTILGMDFTPRTMIIYGAGVIGCEYASIFRGLGIKVNLIDTRSRLLEFLDDEIVDALTYHLRDQGVVVRHNETYVKIAGEADCVAMECASGKKIAADVLLFTNGRSGNTDGMGLDKAGVDVNHRGQIAVNEHFQTALPHIYAVGDVIGPPALASAAYDQGRYAAQYALYGKVEHALTKMIPTGIYTSPEISSLGRTEQDLTASKVPYEVGHAFFKDLARAQIAGRAVGMLKLLFHRDTLELLGIHCFGPQAAEIVHIGQAIMAQPAPHNTVKYFAETTFNYPTMAEAYRVAALNGLNRLR